jgi:uncharacterized protein (DUF488 family)
MITFFHVRSYRQKVRSCSMTTTSIWSLGHSNVTIDEFIDLVRWAEIDTIVDVRSMPFSRYTPHFNKDLLDASLSRAGVTYQFMGDSLGGRPPEFDLYDDEGHVLYSELAKNFRFKNGIEQLCIRAERERVAMMCSEESPQNCHRRLLISRVLSDLGVETLHVRGNRSTQSNAELIELFGPHVTENLFGGEPWRSIQPVLRNGRQNDFS